MPDKSGRIWKCSTTCQYDGVVAKVTDPEYPSALRDAHLIASAPTWLRELLDESDRLRAALVRVIQATGGSATAEASTDFLCAAPDEVTLKIKALVAKELDTGEELMKAASTIVSREELAEGLQGDLVALREAVKWMASKFCPVPCDQVGEWDEKRQRRYVPDEHKAALKAAIES